MWRLSVEKGVEFDGVITLLSQERRLRRLQG